MTRRTTRRAFLKAAGIAAAGGHLALAPRPGPAAPDEAGKRRNVLFLAVDDLRPQLGCYGMQQVRSPNIDALAASGTRFDRAYCQQAICAPSRASLLTGLRPDSTGIYGLRTPVRKALPKVLTLPQRFREAGYTTVSLGKIYHHRTDDKPGWSRPPIRGSGEWKGRGYLDPASLAAMADADAAKRKEKARRPNRRVKLGIGPAFEGADVPDEAYPDGVNTAKAVEALRGFATSGEPFFLAMGYFKPHLPFNAPKKYWDLYPAEGITLPANDTPPKGAPSLATTNWGELRQYTNIPRSGPCDEALSRELIRGYCACVTYIDTLIGRLLGELKRLGLAGNTVIVLWGDHGWKLGEYGDWSKHTNFELDTHVPLMLAGPELPAGRATDALVEFVDVYPTLCELCGLDVPAHCEGTSLVPLLTDAKRPWKSAAFSQYPRGRVMGYSMRTDRYRYTRWEDRRTKKVAAVELYDHQADPGETRNLAANADKKLLARLDAQLDAGWKAAKPKG